MDKLLLNIEQHETRPNGTDHLITIIRNEIQAVIPNAIQQAIEAIKEELKAEIMQKIEDDLFTKKKDAGS